MRAHRTWFVVALVAFALGSAGEAPGAPDDTILVSRQSDTAGGAGANSTSSAASVSDDGRFVAFVSAASNLGETSPALCHPGFLPDNSRVYVRDTLLGRTILVSRADGEFGPSANRCSGNPSISADGRFVAFSTEASNFDPADPVEGTTDVYVRDLQSFTTKLASRMDGPDGAVGDGPSGGASVSDDGLRVAFLSNAGNLSPVDAVTIDPDGAEDDTYPDVFVRDLTLNTTILISRKSGEDGDAQNGNGWSSEISGDGRRVVFGSEAENLSEEDGNALMRNPVMTRNIFVRDVDAPYNTVLVNRATGEHGATSISTAERPTISADGRYVAFDSWADNLSDDDYDYEDDPDPRGESYDLDVFVRDIDGYTTTLVSRATGADGAGASPCFDEPLGTGGPARISSISRGGRYVSFMSCADNLSADDDDGLWNTYVRDTVANTTTLVSRTTGASGAAANADSNLSAISDDGVHVAFQTLATNLSAIDGPSFLDVFMRDTGLPRATTDWLVNGSGLKLKDHPTHPERRLMSVSAKDPLFDVDTPVLTRGASLRVIGTTFDVTYPLPKEGWSQAGTTMRYRDKAMQRGPVVSVNLNAMRLRVTAKGAQLPDVLDVNPGPVKVVLEIALRRFCMEFGGTVKYTAGRVYQARNALPPTACPE